MPDLGQFAVNGRSIRTCRPTVVLKAEPLRINAAACLCQQHKLPCTDRLHQVSWKSLHSGACVNSLWWRRLWSGQMSGGLGLFMPARRWRRRRGRFGSAATPALRLRRSCTAASGGRSASAASTGRTPAATRRSAACAISQDNVGTGVRVRVGRDLVKISSVSKGCVPSPSYNTQMVRKRGSSTHCTYITMTVNVWVKISSVSKGCVLSPS